VLWCRLGSGTDIGSLFGVCMGTKHGAIDADAALSWLQKVACDTPSRRPAGLAAILPLGDYVEVLVVGAGKIAHPTSDMTSEGLFSIDFPSWIWLGGQGELHEPPNPARPLFLNEGFVPGSAAVLNLLAPAPAETVAAAIRGEVAIEIEPPEEPDREPDKVGRVFVDGLRRQETPRAPRTPPVSDRPKPPD